MTIHSVYEVTTIIKSTLTSSIALQNLFVQGEISNFSRPASGHLYFTLKDDKARLRVVMFAGSARYLQFLPSDGMRVIVRGSLDVFEKSGDYQLYAKEMQPDGIGALYLAFEQVKERLQKAGWFEADRKKAIPAFPKTIALITSGTGAAVRDMITTLNRRYPLATVRVVPVAVQGDEAPKQIAAAIDLVDRHLLADVMIVGRGGGSFEELFAFNTEIVATAIEKATIPVITAVGHETDTTISDFVADLRAPTPTAAAEIVSPDQTQLFAHILDAMQKLTSIVNRQNEQRQRTLERLINTPFFQEPMRLISRYHEYLDRQEVQMRDILRAQLYRRQKSLSFTETRLAKTNPYSRLMLIKSQLKNWEERLEKAKNQVVQSKEKHLVQRIDQLSLLNPLSVMQRGYAIVYNHANRAVISQHQLHPGEQIRVELVDGWLDCQVWGVYEREGREHDV